MPAGRTCLRVALVGGTTACRRSLEEGYHLLDRFEVIEARYEELTQLLANPDQIADAAEFSRVAKEHADLGEIVAAFREYEKVRSSLEEAETILREENDAELRELARAERGGAGGAPYQARRTAQGATPAEGSCRRKRTSLWRSGPEPAETRPRFSPPTFFRMYCATPSVKGGVSNSSAHPPPSWADSKRLSSWSTVKEPTAG